jgi:hypothetical protein
MFPAPMAASLGIDLASDCEERPCSTAGGEVTQHVYDSGLEIEIQAMGRRVTVSAAFNPALPLVLLGRLDFFSQFKVCFDERNRTFTLEAYED